MWNRTDGCLGRLQILGKPNKHLLPERTETVSESQEIAMGADGAKSVNQSIGLLDHQNVQGYVQGLGMKLASDSERAQLPWSFAVLDDPTPNAFAFPGAYVFVTPSLVGLIRNEAALVSVARTRDRPKLIEAKK